MNSERWNSEQWIMSIQAMHSKTVNHETIDNTKKHERNSETVEQLIA